MYKASIASSMDMSSVTFHVKVKEKKIVSKKISKNFIFCKILKEKKRKEIFLFHTNIIR